MAKQMNVKELDDFQHDLQYFDSGWEATCFYIWKVSKSIEKLTKEVKEKNL